MNNEQINQLIKQMRQQFKSQFKNKNEEEIDKMILDIFFQAYCENKMDRQDLKTLTNALGYEVNDKVIDKIEKERRK